MKKQNKSKQWLLAGTVIPAFVLASIADVSAMPRDAAARTEIRLAQAPKPEAQEADEKAKPEEKAKDAEKPKAAPAAKPAEKPAAPAAAPKADAPKPAAPKADAPKPPAPKAAEPAPAPAPKAAEPKPAPAPAPKAAEPKAAPAPAPKAAEPKAAPAAEPKPTAQDKREERQEKRENRREDAREQRQEKQQEKRQDAREERQEKKQDAREEQRKDAQQEKRENTREQRQEKQQDAKDKQQEREEKREEKRDAREERRDDRRDARRFEELKRERREERQGDRTVIREGDRTIIRDGNRVIIRRDETDRFRRGDRDVRVVRRNGQTRTISVRPNGVEIITVTDDRGRLLRRIRRGRDGREVIIIDNTFRGARRGDFYVNLPPPVIRIPRERYIVEAAEAPPAVIYDTLMAPPVERIDRRYTLDEVLYSPDVRARMPRVDLDTVNFEFGSWELSPGQVDRLAPIADGIRRAVERNPNEVFLIEGHTDAVGSDIDNLSLSDRRAETVAVILTDEFGVPPENLTVQGYGEQYLKIDTPAPERQNRRVTVRRITPLITGEAR